MAFLHSVVDGRQESSAAGRSTDSSASHGALPGGIGTAASRLNPHDIAVHGVRLNIVSEPCCDVSKKACATSGYYISQCGKLSSGEDLRVGDEFRPPNFQNEAEVLFV